MTDPFDSDIGALLDSVLQDKTEPPVQEAAPPQPDEALVEVTEPDGTTYLADQGDIPDEALSPLVILPDENGETMPVTLASLLDEGEAIGELEGQDKHLALAHGVKVTTVVSADSDTLEEDKAKDDELTAELPAIDSSMFSEEVPEATIQVPNFTSDELMKEIDIRNFGTLVSLTNRRWHAKVKDRKAAKDAADASGADAETFEARKRLLVGADEKLKRVHKAIDAARTDHYRMTLPWSTVGINDHGKRAGSRLLPNSLFFDYAQMMGQHKAEMLESLEKFTTAYPTLIAISQQKLGTAFNQNEYPSPSAIEAHFALEFDFEPIPVGGDYQGLQDAQVEKLAGALERKTKLRLENAMQDAWKSLYDDVERAATALSNPDAMFHYTMFDKLGEQASMLSHLNVTGDNHIEATRLDVKRHLTNIDVKDVRKDDALRRRLGELATGILERMQEYANVSPAETN